MDDYYSLLGVDSDAATDEIRAAYRDRKAAIDASTETGRAEAAALNKAWNVLSDPYQRGRYDERLAAGDEDGDEDGVMTEAQSNGRGSSRKPAAQPARPRGGRPVAAPTINPPAGTRFAPPKQRGIAMGIDLLVLVLAFLGLQFVSTAFASAQKPEVTHKIDRLNDQITAANKQKDADGKTLSEAKKGTDANATAAAQQKIDADKRNIDDLQKQHDDEASKLNTYFFGGLALAFLFGFLYLWIPSALTGRTLGKRLQHIKAIRESGAPLGWGGAALRYGLLAAATMALYVVLRELAAVLVIVGVTLWLRNPNMQGLHDRWTHTIVVADAE